MQRLLERLEQLRGQRSVNQLASEARLSRSTIVNLYRGQGTMSSLHELANYFWHLVSFDVEGFDREGLPFGEQIQKLRQSKGFNVKELSKQSGVSELTIARIERGADATLPVVARLVEACGAALVLLSQDEIEYRWAKRDLDEWLDDGKLPFHALTDVVIPFDQINFTLQRRLDQRLKKVVFGN